MATQNFNPTQDGQDPSGPSPIDATNTSMPVIQQNTPINKITNNVQGGGSGGSSSGGGLGGIGSFLGPIGSILGGLFAEGGMVGDKSNGYAQGGMGTQPSGGDNTALAKGYLVGALHQKKFGGTPDTLPKAAQEIKAMLSGQGGQPQGMASGGALQGQNDQQGMNQADQQLAMQSLMQALGMNNQGSQQAQPPQATQNPPISSQQTAPNIPIQSNMPQGMQNSMAGGNPNQMRGYAAGGAGMSAPQDPQQGADPNAQPPLQPGQAFQGDGSVKGPGTGNSDSIPAKLSNGEFVISSPAVSFFGVDKLTKLNEQGKKGFMEAQQQVQDNQPGAQGQSPAQPGQPPQSPIMPQPQAQASSSPMGQMPMAQKSGGTVNVSAMRPKASGYCGL